MGTLKPVLEIGLQNKVVKMYLEGMGTATIAIRLKIKNHWVEDLIEERGIRRNYKEALAKKKEMNAKQKENIEWTNK